MSVQIPPSDCGSVDHESRTIEEISPPAAAVSAFRQRLRGELLQPGERLYDETRSVWNAMVNRRPLMIAR